MTEKKRFSLGEDGAWTWVIDHTELDNGYDGQLTASECVDLLNALHEENEKLKLKLFDCNLELEHSKESVDDAYWELTEIKKENVQLKKENQELHKLNQEYIDSLSDEKKETLSEMLNAILGDDVE